jgi:DNA mismatch endonuclease (patch repair protein)
MTKQKRHAVPPSGPAAPAERGRSWASSLATRRSMQSNRSKDTALELAVRSALHRRGFRYRKHVRPIPELRCTPDVVFPRHRLAVFVDGCWWHSCPEHRSYPRTNGSWWRSKLEANVARDSDNNQRLVSAGWTVLHVWEHQTVEEIVSSIVAKLSRTGALPHNRKKHASDSRRRVII